jgi:hypothetical protein
MFWSIGATGYELRIGAHLRRSRGPIVPIIEKLPATQEQRSLLYLAGLAKIEELIGIREEYEEWQSNLSENFASSQDCEAIRSRYSQCGFPNHRLR